MTKPFVLLNHEELDSLSNELYDKITKIPLYDVHKRKETIKKHMSKVQSAIAKNIYDMDDTLISNIKEFVMFDKLQ